MKQEHFEILMEEMSSKFNLVMEGHQGLHREMGEMRTELKQDIELCNFKIDVLNSKINTVQDELDGKIDGVKDELNGKIDGVKNELGKKIDSVATDLKAHRQDTELHHGVYQVKE